MKYERRAQLLFVATFLLLLIVPHFVELYRDGVRIGID